MIQLEVTSQPRSTRGKGAARTLRRAGRTPAVLYGTTMEPVSLSLDTHTFTQAVLGLQRRNAVVNLSVEGGETYQVFIKELQVDPIHDTLKHADFYQVIPDKEYVFTVPLKYTGKAKGVALGGELQVAQTKVKVKAKPMLVPESIEVALNNLNQGDSVQCDQLVVAEGIKLLTPAKMVLVSVV